jgi:flagellin
MNAYRNFSTNGSKLNKNLEKLSTGYKINRAGDDAAGLAISEKMRAQITGLEGATKNAKDGISLIQTAEGALTEVHDMLNRMVTLSEQSANGTYDDELDRNQLQKEVDALKSEIDRIADSVNYNGIKLLDGSLSGAGSLQGNVRTNDTIATAATATAAAFTAVAGSLNEGDKISYDLTFKDASGEHRVNLEFTIDETKSFMVAKDGTSYAVKDSKNIEIAQINNAVLGELQKDKGLTNAFDITSSNNQLTFTSKVKGTEGAVVTNVDTRANFKEITGTKDVGSKTFDYTNAFDSMQKIDLSSIKILGRDMLDKSGDIEKAVKDNTFTVDGKKFILMGSNEDYEKMKAVVGSDTTIIKLASQTAETTKYLDAATFSTSKPEDSKIIAAELSRVTGRDFTYAKAAPESEDPANPQNKGVYVANDILLKGEKLSKGGKELTLQVGDTSDDFNQVGVKVADMHVDALGLTGVDISTQKGAQEAVSVIKNAVNKVSDTRGGLGALQNRLDHTINNLGVMRENIQSAEGLIRDTDVAEEMMTYTKNSILNQSAQAMLAQANQLPQGVLQLLG